MRDESIVEIIDVNERFKSGIVFNFGRIIDKVGTYRKELIEQFNVSLDAFIDNNYEFFDKIYDVESMIYDKIDEALDKIFSYVTSIGESIPKQVKAEKKSKSSTYKLKSFGFDELIDEDITEMREFRLEDYDTDEFKSVRRRR